MKRTGPTNPVLADLITALKTVSIEKKVPLWKRVATELEKPSRKRRKVNTYHIQECAKDGEIILVPGKVLATGDITKKVTVAAWDFSEEASKKIKETMSIETLLKENPQGKNVRIIG